MMMESLKMSEGTVFEEVIMQDLDVLSETVNDVIARVEALEHQAKLALAILSGSTSNE